MLSSTAHTAWSDSNTAHKLPRRFKHWAYIQCVHSDYYMCPAHLVILPSILVSRVLLSLCLCSVKNITPTIFDLIIKVCNGTEPVEASPPTRRQLQRAEQQVASRFERPPAPGTGGWAIIITLYRVSCSTTEKQQQVCMQTSCIPACTEPALKAKAYVATSFADSTKVSLRQIVMQTCIAGTNLSLQGINPTLMLVFLLLGCLQECSRPQGPSDLTKVRHALHHTSGTQHVGTTPEQIAGAELASSQQLNRTIS